MTTKSDSYKGNKAKKWLSKRPSSTQGYQEVTGQ